MSISVNWINSFSTPHGWQAERDCARATGKFAAVIILRGEIAMKKHDSIVDWLAPKSSPLMLAPAEVNSRTRSAGKPHAWWPVWLSSDDREEVEVMRRRSGEGGDRERAQAPSRRQRDDAPAESRSSNEWDIVCELCACTSVLPSSDISETDGKQLPVQRRIIWRKTRERNWNKRSST